MAEVDLSWLDLTEPFERLRWARLRKFASATAFARALGMNKDTYSAYEREPGSSKYTRLSSDAAIRFGRLLKIRWEWLVTGQGEPWPAVEEEDSPRGRIIRALSDIDPFEQERVAQMVELMTAAGGRRG